MDALQKLLALGDRLEALPWDACERAGTLDELLAAPAVRKLKAALLAPRSRKSGALTHHIGPGFARCNVGLNAGTSFVSFNLRSAGAGQASASDADADVDAADEALAAWLCVILARHDQQEELEAAWTGPDLLANYLVEQLSERAGVALCHVSWNAKSGGVRAVFCSRAVVDDRLSGKNRWRYSRSYRTFFLRAAGSADRDQASFPPPPPPRYDGSRAEAVAEEVAQATWAGLAAAQYVADEALTSALRPLLREYVLGGISGPGEGFNPSSLPAKRLAFFLAGGAGVGKSTFVELFGACLQRALQAHVSPTLQVNIVKVPLNALSLDSLVHIIRIQGLSDWSVERMVEQSVAKENIAILHLEEVPREPAEQERLFGPVRSMVEHLLRRYPERAGSVVFALTSNYEPCDSIQALSRATVHVAPPGPQARREWALEKLRRCARDAAPAAGSELLKVDVADALELRDTDDMRPLNNWWLSLAFCGTRLLGRLEASAQGAAIAFDKSDEAAAVVTASAGRESITAPLVSHDGCFFFDPEAHGSPAGAVFEMAARGFTSPSVLIFDYSDRTDLDGAALEAELAAARLEVSRELREAVAAVPDAHLRLSDLGTLQDETDKSRIYGDAAEIRGGVFKFIDDTNNPNVAISATPGDCLVCGAGRACSASRSGGAACVAAVFATVSRVGQFMLRELLETSTRSRTHRTSVAKRGVVFVLWALPGEPLTPQCRSRAHHIHRSIP